MSYSSRSSDVYSRRPADDRHRDAASGDDRRRRSADALTKDRYNGPGSPIDPSRPTLSGSARPLHRKTSTSSWSANSSGPDRGSASEPLAGLCKTYAEAVVEVARLRAERDPLDKLLKQRTAEYERSMAKHAELFPSVPEVQNMHRKKYDDRVAWLDAQIHKAQRSVDSLAESIAQAISEALASDREAEARAPSTASSQQHEVVKLQAEIAELKTALRKAEADRMLEQAALRAEFRRQMDETRQQMQKQMQDALSDVKKEVMKEINGIKWTREEADEDVKNQVREVRDDVRKFRADYEQSRNDITAQLSNHEQELERLEKQRFVTKAEITARLQTETSALKSAMSGLTSRVEALAGGSTLGAEEAASLRSRIDECTERVQDATRKIEEHEIKLSNLDMPSLDGLAETISMWIPELQKKVDAVSTAMSELQKKVDAVSTGMPELQKKVDAVPGEIKRQQQGLFDQVVKYVGGMGSTLGEVVDEVQKDVAGTKKRIEALEQASAAREPVPGVDGPATGQPTSAEFEAIRLDVASVKADVESCRAVIQDLRQENAGLSGKVVKAAQDASAFNENLNKQLDAVRQWLLGLDARFSNLSTRTLAECIIGHLRQLYPQADQLEADIEALKGLVERTRARIGTVETKLEDFTVRVGSFDETTGADRMFDRTGQIPAPLVGMVERDPEQAQVGTKRKRLDPATNGSGRPAVDGLG